MIQLHTNHGTITLELDNEKAPHSTANFIQYVQEGHYDKTIFHRVIHDFMIQGGGFTSDMTQKPTRAAIECESKNGLKNDKYTIAMARTMQPHSATAQFFINVVDNPNLNHPQPDGWGYAVFGKVSAGFEVVDQIQAVKTARSGSHQNVPIEDVVITKAEVI